MEAFFFSFILHQCLEGSYDRQTDSYKPSPSYAAFSLTISASYCSRFSQSLSLPLEPPDTSPRPPPVKAPRRGTSAALRSYLQVDFRAKTVSSHLQYAWSRKSCLKALITNDLTQRIGKNCQNNHWLLIYCQTATTKLLHSACFRNQRISKWNCCTGWRVLSSLWKRLFGAFLTLEMQNSLACTIG